MHKEKDLLRLVTAGSIDDGKSTLIGRLLYESKGIYKDQLTSIEDIAKKKGEKEIDLSLLVDGLKSEREQGITIDVAYRYFSTQKRKFIIADSPGHVQYTRNMVTAASTADLAVIIIDARKGVLEQTKRHSFIATLLDIPHILVLVNKMDLVGYSEDVYEKIKEDYLQFASRLPTHDIQIKPISALRGDMVVKKGNNMNWYDGRTFLHYLESVNIVSDRNLIDFRFPVQTVIRPNLDFRGYAGRIESGVIKVGDDIAVLPSGKKSRIKSIETYDRKLDKAFTPQSVVLTLENHIDISRGDMLIRQRNVPEIRDELEAEVCWMAEEPMEEGGEYLIKHTTNTVPVILKELRYKIDINTLHREEKKELGLNDIGRVIIKAQKPIFFDPYVRNHKTGSFIIIDELTNATVGAGIIWYPSATLPETENSQ
ncbi:MAG: sulfate adenylyltransferase subunit CysN [Candidatus Omnitrophica bacterium]|nr:sulfate adenylyltransferase subunit CysN [Candidatus Omnitrophota bacterium]MCF7893386.1 sulfate adenylyltransferase subunit CysN [Candidatus Omnitrophota bacterium]